MAKEQAQNAVVAVLAPICVEKFQRQADAATELVEFKKVSSSWDRRSIIEKGGWATMAGNPGPNSAGVIPLPKTTGGPLLKFVAPPPPRAGSPFNSRTLIPPTP